MKTNFPSQDYGRIADAETSHRRKASPLVLLLIVDSYSEIKTWISIAK